MCIPKSPNDFYACFEKEGLKICINSPSDNTEKIDEGFAFYLKHEPDILISSCREERKLYNHFFQRYAITEKDIVVELPLAKITRKNKAKREQALKWYKEKIDKLVIVILKNEFGV